MPTVPDQPTSDPPEPECGCCEYDERGMGVHHHEVCTHDYCAYDDEDERP